MTTNTVLEQKKGTYKGLAATFTWYDGTPLISIELDEVNFIDLNGEKSVVKFDSLACFKAPQTVLNWGRKALETAIKKGEIAFN
jgi:hypothetical protein